MWLALSLLLLTSFHFYHLPPRLPSPASNFLPIHSKSAPVCQRLYCAPVLLKVLYCMITNVYFCHLFLMYHLCEKHYKPFTVQYYITDCVNWVPRLTFGLMNVLSEHHLFICRGLTILNRQLLFVHAFVITWIDVVAATKVG